MFIYRQRFVSIMIVISLALYTAGCNNDVSIPSARDLSMIAIENIPDFSEPLPDMGDLDMSADLTDVQTDPLPEAQWGLADLSCHPPNNPSTMPDTAREYASLCAEHGLGLPPSVRCEDAVRVPTMVNGQEVFETPQSCDHTSMLKPTCDLGSKIGRVQGRDSEGNLLPDVVWIYFCRAAAETVYSSSK
jgi:hypothetical protein